MTTERYSRINGGLLQSHVGRKVCLLGQFMSIDKLGRMLKIKLTDDVVIMAAFDTTITNIPDLNQWVQVLGHLENRNKLKAQLLDVFPLEMTEKFDRDLYNDMIAVTFEHVDDFSITEAEYETHFGTTDPGKDGEHAQAIKIDTFASGDDEPVMGEMNFDDSFATDFNGGGGF